MSVHRIDDNAESLLLEMSMRDEKKPGQWLSDLVRDYAKGLSFDGDPTRFTLSPRVYHIMRHGTDPSKR